MGASEGQRSRKGSDLYGCIRFRLQRTQCSSAGVSAALINHLSSHDLVDAGSCMNSRRRLEELQIQGPKILPNVDLVQPHV
jgi:hypothetical protein